VGFLSGIVFINYRRDDTGPYAGWIHDRLRPKFPEHAIFRDVHGIDYGEDFVRAMLEKVEEADVMLALIGRDWALVTDREGRRRLDSPADPVRVELEAALSRNKSIIPVLCGSVEMPSAELLPDTLKPLVTKVGMPITNERFDEDIAKLEAVIKKALAKVQLRREEEQERSTREAAAERVRLEEAARQEAARQVEQEAERKRAAEQAERRKAERARISREAEQARRRAEELERLLAADEDAPRDALSASASMSFIDHQVAKAEELANWDFVKGRGKIDELREHLQRWPDGVTVRMARAMLESLEWIALGDTPPESALRDFVVAFRDGEHGAEAKRKIAALEEARKSETGRQPPQAAGKRQIPAGGADTVGSLATGQEQQRRTGIAHNGPLRGMVIVLAALAFVFLFIIYLGRMR
jgi:hypothetical protein